MSKFCKLLFVFLAITFTLGFAEGADKKPLEIARAVADKVIRETGFEFEQVFQDNVLGIEVLDFRRTFGESAEGVAYARSSIISEKDTTVLFGVSSSGDMKLWVNQQSVFQRSGNGHAEVTEIAYGMVIFEDTISIQLKEGANEVLVKSASRPEEWVVLLRPMTEDGMPEPSVRFTLVLELRADGNGTSAWLHIGPFNASEQGINQVYPPEESIKPFYRVDSQNFVWKKNSQNVLAQLVIPTSNSYKRESYIEWHYSTGALHLALLALADETGDNRYSDFAKRFCEFTHANHDFFKWQYEVLHAFRGTYHRLFRRTMLDDTGAPALPFVKLQLQDQRVNYWQLIKPISEYIFNKQVRLTDRTFCRPEPVRYTVWADDLFMSVPFMLRLGKLTGEEKYFDDAALQVKNFSKRLFNQKGGLFKHGWFSSTSQTSLAFWGRANGWIAWATSEALTHLPQSHRDYEAVLEIFREHMAGLARYQDQSGMWHQVLDYPESYEETSCTAMFALAMARGVRNGWLDDSFADRAIKAWDALAKKIDPDGTVHGICRGTGIGNSLDFYFERQTFDHDPRGLGAVIFAGIEVTKMRADLEP